MEEIVGKKTLENKLVFNIRKIEKDLLLYLYIAEDRTGKTIGIEPDNYLFFSNNYNGKKAYIRKDIIGGKQKWNLW